MSPTGSSPPVRVQRIGNKVVLVLSAGLEVTKILLSLGVSSPQESQTLNTQPSCIACL